MPALRIEEFQDKLRECTIFGSIDIKETYHQIAIDVKIANFCVIRTTECIIFGSINIKETYHQIAIDMKIAYLCVIRTTHQ